MASGSSGRSNPNSKGFDFTSSDDILCSYEDFETNQDNSNGTHSDPPSLSSNSTKEFHKSRMVRSSMFPAPACSPQEDSFSQDVIATVEKTMKKHTDNLMRFLEGISSRLSQLELYCYNLDKSIGEMRTDLVRDHGEADSKLRSVEKHLQEVHRSVQILRDKQELAETQKELAKMQLAQKESSSANEDKASVPSSDQKSPDNTSDGHGQELALVLPNQVSSTTRPVVQQQTLAPPPPQAGTQSQGYYLPPAAHMPNQQAPIQPQPAQSPYLPPDAQYRIPQMQEVSRVPPQPAQSLVNQAQHVHPLPQYQQHWSQQPQVRPPSSGPYPSYLPSQPPNPSQQEAVPNSVSMLPYSGISQQQGSSRAEQMPYGYGGLGQAVQQQPPPQHLKSNFGVQPNAGYTGPGNPYVLYESEGGQRNHPPQQPPHFPQGGYPPTSVPQSPQANAGNHMARPPQFARGHPYGELVEKLASMGYRGDHVASVIQRLEETGQPVDFNSVLDKLNGLSSGGGQRGWSG